MRKTSSSSSSELVPILAYLVAALARKVRVMQTVYSKW